MASFLRKVFNTHIAIVLILPLVFFGCTDDELTSDIVVIPEQVMQVSSDYVRLSGRIIASSALNIADHGFEISETEDFASPIIISLGTRTNPGRFFGDTGDLSIKTAYFWRPFILIGNSQLVGESRTFSTANPSILDFNPKQGLGGTLITIEGSNFTEDIQVFIDGRNTQIKEVVLDTKIIVIVPSMQNNRFTKVQLVSQDTTIEFTMLFEYVVGKWEQVGEFITQDFYHKTLSMVVGNQLIYGLGLINFAPNDMLWTYDIDLDTWTPLAFTGTSVTDPFNAAPYFGGGNVIDSDNLTVNSNEFYRYENGQIASLGFTPFRLARSMAFVWDGKLYVLGGVKEDKIFNSSIYQYDPASALWSQVGTSPALFDSDFPHFQYLDNIYFLITNRDLWRYNITSGLWDIISQFPLSVGKNGISEVLGSKVYIGIFIGNRTLTEYDAITNTWSKKIGFEGNFSENTGGSWAYNDEVYLLKNQKIITRKPMIMWRFAPDAF